MGPIEQITKIGIVIILSFVAMKVASKVLKLGLFCVAFVFLLLCVGII